MVLNTSDVHLSPGDLIPQYLMDMFRECDATGSRAVLLGDVFNLLPYGERAWLTNAGDYTIQRFVDLLPRGGCDLIFGNHEGNIKWLEELFQPYPQVRVARSLNLFIGNQTWHFEHGHRFAYNWRWLQWVADDITQVMVKHFPGLWYRLSRQMEWVPSRIMVEKPQRYNEKVGTIWSNALKWAQKENINLVIGHTHTRVNIKLGSGIQVIDCGAKEIIKIP